ncbi:MULTISPECIES: phage tail protein [Serratia]|uniref:Phage tail protein n=1 Tax=Serratia proteamaculans TaxID=28151 RepID=A0A7U0N8W6_SERPR|nr:MULTISPECIES: phage tail protein [Serratia]MBO1504451.1 phage tail protein [Serratia proteamaculans]MDW5512527.1 phage tail protein [Serratia proteamaculans]QQX54553.1 phage tail protein [Serratia proteamaculans]
MLKPEQLRTALANALPDLQTHPDKLHISLDNGRVVSTLGPSLSFEYQYQLNLTLSDQVNEEDLVMVTVLAWLRSHQPDILANAEKRKNGFTFKRDISAAGQLDLQLQLTERIQVEQRDGALHITPLTEPPLPENVIRFTQVYLHGELISQFQQP